MAVRNEIQIGQDSRYNNMTMFRKVDNVPFNPQYSFDENDNLSTSSNITVNYLEYFKNSDGVIVPELTKHKYYVVPNIEGTTKQVTVVDSPATYYAEGEVITPAVLAVEGDILVPAVMDGDVEVTPAVVALGGEIITPAVIALGGELKTEEINHQSTVVDREEWLAANNWFMTLARTPITAPYGIMDGIEGTLSGLPMDVPNGYVLQQPL